MTILSALPTSIRPVLSLFHFIYVVIALVQGLREILDLTMKWLKQRFQQQHHLYMRESLDTVIHWLAEAAKYGQGVP